MKVHFTVVKRSPLRLWLRHYDEALTWYVDFTEEETEFARKVGLHRWKYFLNYMLLKKDGEIVSRSISYKKVLNSSSKHPVRMLCKGSDYSELMSKVKGGLHSMKHYMVHYKEEQPQLSEETPINVSYDI